MSAGRVVQAVSVVTVPRPYPPGAGSGRMHEATGRTIRRIAAALLIRTGVQQTDLGALLAEIR